MVQKPKTQAERTASTRKRLLDATIACLNEHGYAATSTPLIARRAGVSRGAQLHHFPTKAELVVSAIEHLFERHLHEFREAIQQVAAHEDRIAAAIDLLWAAMSEEQTRHTWIELVVGTRNEPVLRDKVQEVARRLAQAMLETFMQDVVQGPALPEVAVLITTALMDGLLLQRLAGLDDERAAQVIEAYKAVARLATVALQMGQIQPSPKDAP